MNTVVRLSTDDDGDKREDAEEWHLVDPENGAGPSLFCTGEFFGEGESAGACVTHEKTTKRGGITCPDCLSKLRAYKAIRL